MIPKIQSATINKGSHTSTISKTDDSKISYCSKINDPTKEGLFFQTYDSANDPALINRIQGDLSRAKSMTINFVA